MQGTDSEELAAASKQDDEVSFYQTSNADVAKLFHIDPQGKRPSLVLLKKEDEKISHFGTFFLNSLKFLNVCIVMAGLTYLFMTGLFVMFYF